MVLLKSPGLPSPTGHSRGRCVHDAASPARTPVQPLGPAPSLPAPGALAGPWAMSADLAPCHIPAEGILVTGQCGPDWPSPATARPWGPRTLPPAGPGALRARSRQVVVDIVGLNFVGEACVNWPKNKFKMAISAFFCLVEEYCFSLFASWGGSVRGTWCLQGGGGGEAKPCGSCTSGCLRVSY